MTRRRSGEPSAKELGAGGRIVEWHVYRLSPSDAMPVRVGSVRARTAAEARDAIPTLGRPAAEAPHLFVIAVMKPVAPTRPAVETPARLLTLAEVAAQGGPLLREAVGLFESMLGRGVLRTGAIQIFIAAVVIEAREGALTWSVEAVHKMLAELVSVEAIKMADKVTQPLRSITKPPEGRA